MKWNEEIVIDIGTTKKSTYAFGYNFTTSMLQWKLKKGSIYGICTRNSTAFLINIMLLHAVNLAIFIYFFFSGDWYNNLGISNEVLAIKL